MTKNYYSFIIDPFPDFNFDEISENPSLWLEKRKFVPKEPKVWFNKLAFPLYDICGEFQQYQIRSNTAHQFDKDRYKLTGKVYEPVHQTDKEVFDSKYLLVEGTADCALLRSYGFNAVTCLGAEKFKTLRAKDFLSGKTFFYFFDNDVWGNKMAELMKDSSGIRLMIPSQYKDFNEFLIKSKNEFENWIDTYKVILS